MKKVLLTLAIVVGLLGSTACQGKNATPEELKQSLTKVAEKAGTDKLVFMRYYDGGTAEIYLLKDSKIQAFDNKGELLDADTTVQKPYGTIPISTLPVDQMINARQATDCDGKKPAVFAAATLTGKFFTETICGNDDSMAQFLEGKKLPDLGSDPFSVQAIGTVLSEGKAIFGTTIANITITNDPTGATITYQAGDITLPNKKPCQPTIVRYMDSGNHGSKGFSLSGASRCDGMTGNKETGSFPASELTAERITKAINAGLDLLGSSSTSTLTNARIIIHKGKPVISLLSQTAGGMVTVDLNGKRVG